MRRLYLVTLLQTLLALFAATAFTQEPNPDERKESEESVLARSEHWLKKRLDENGEFSMEAVLRAKTQLDQKLMKGVPRTPFDAGIWNWQWLGPGNIGGRIQDILINPFNANQMWIASPGGGIWRSTNAGGSWSPINDFLPILNVVSLAMDYIQPQIMYAGTGEYEYFGGYGNPTASGSKISGVGIFKSTDGGVSWVHLTNTDSAKFRYVSRLAHYPATANWLLAATIGGLFRTTNGGSNWTRILDPDFHEPVRDVEINPANISRILVGTTTDVYLTTNGGSSWTRETSGDTNKMPSRPGRCEVAIARTNTNVMYVSMSRGAGEIWRTTDGGLTWNFRAGGTTANPYATAIWVSPTDPNEILVGGTGNLLRNTNGGAGGFLVLSDWQCYQNGRALVGCPGFSPHGDFHVIVNHPSYDGSANKTVYVGNDGGIQYTANISTVTQYTGWANLANNLGITQFYGGAAAPNGSVIVGGTQDLYNVSYYENIPPWGSGSGSQGWWNFIYGDGGYAAVDYNNPKYIYAEAQNLGFDRSDDSGKTYTAKRSGLLDAAPGTLNTLFVAPIALDPNNAAVVLAGGASVWRTTNRGDNWTQFRPALAGSPSPKCSAIDIYKANSGVIWVGYDNGLVSYTITNGSTWIDAGSPGGNRFVTDIAINPTPMATAEVIVTVGGYSGGNVWLTTNNGANWIQRTGTAPDDLPALQVNTVRYHPLQTNWIYVGTDLGVFASEDKGLHWNVTPRYSANEGPLNTPVEELFWQGTSYLIAATHGRGMWRCKPLPVFYVDGAYVGTEEGTQFQPYNTVQEAVNMYGPGAVVSVKAGTYDVPALTINKRGRVTATNGVVRMH